MSQEDRKYKLKIWEEKNSVKARVMFIARERLIDELRDLLIENIRGATDLKLVMDIGYPAVGDSNFFLFNNDVYAQGQELLKELREEFPENIIFPGILHLLFKTKKYKQYQDSHKERNIQDNQVMKTIDNLCSFKVSTYHDYSELVCSSKVHGSSELINEFQRVAKKLKIELQLESK